MKRIAAVVAVLIFVSVSAYSQLSPDKLVFASDSTLVDSLKRSEYPYLFPIWGEKVQKLGIKMPLSAGLGVNYIWSDADLVIQNISVGFNDGPMYDLSNVIRLSGASASVSGVNIRPDIWILPFLNVYGIFGKAKTSTSIDAGVWLPDSSNNWHQVTAFSSKANFDATTFGFGLTPTFGLGGGWVALDMNFAWTDISALSQPAFSFVIGPRFGKTFKFNDPEETLALWVGAFRLNIASETSGSINLSDVLPLDGLQSKVDQGQIGVGEAQQQVDAWWNSLSNAQQQNPVNKAKHDAANKALETAGNLLTNLDGALSNSESATVQYSLNKSQAKLWNFIVGAQYQLNPHLMFRGEYGFLGTRQQFIGGIQYRFGL